MANNNSIEAQIKLLGSVDPSVAKALSTVVSALQKTEQHTEQLNKKFGGLWKQFALGELAAMTLVPLIDPTSPFNGESDVAKQVQRAEIPCKGAAVDMRYSFFVLLTAFAGSLATYGCSTFVSAFLADTLASGPEYLLSGGTGLFGSLFDYLRHLDLRSDCSDRVALSETKQMNTGPILSRRASEA